MIDVNVILQKCFKHSVKVYPVNVNWKWYIEADINGRKKRFDKPVEYKNLNESIIKTYEYYSEKL